MLSRIKRKQNTEVKSNKMEETLLDIIVEAYPDEEILKADGFDEAIIGIDDHSILFSFYS